MAVLPEFYSGNESYARSANSFIGGLQAGQSMMERKQLMSLRQQQADQQQAEFQAKLPVIQAAAQADLASAHASILNSARMEQLRTQAASDSKGFNDEYLNAMQIASWSDRADALSALQPKVSYMSLFPEYKGFVDTVNNSRVEAHNSSLADQKLQEQQAESDARSEDAQAARDAAIERTRLIVEGRTTNVGIGTASRERIAQTAAEAKRDAALNHINKTYELEVTIQKRDEAIQSGDTELAQVFQDRANKLNSSPSSVDRPLPTSVRPKPVATAPVGVSVEIPGSGMPPSGEGSAPTEKSPTDPKAIPVKTSTIIVNPDAQSIVVEGKTYPIQTSAYYVKDGSVVYVPRGEPAGKTITVDGRTYPVKKTYAYLKDGHYVQVKSSESP